MRSIKPAPLTVEGGLGTAQAPLRTGEPAARLWAFWRVARWGLFAGALVFCLLVLSGTVKYFATDEPLLMRDGAAYYFSDTPYDWSDRPAGAGEYRFSPAFLFVIAPLRLLPWEAFAAVWFAAHVAVLLYLRLPWMLIFPGVMEDALWGNINTFLALAVVLIVRRGAAPLWATVFLTKVTPGVAVVWHAARREWRELAVAAGVTAVIIGVGVAVDPQLWFGWWLSLITGPDTYPTTAYSPPLALRLAIGASAAVFAAVTNRAWLLPVAMLVAVPGFWPNSFALLLASVALYKGRLTMGDGGSSPLPGKTRPPRS